MDFSLILLPLAIVLLIFMMFNSRKRMQKMKAEQEAKQRQTVPGAEVMLNSGIFGTIVAFDPDDLDKPAEIEIAPGVVIKAHSQAIARIVDPVDEPALAAELAELPADHPDHIRADEAAAPAAAEPAASSTGAEGADAPAAEGADAPAAATEESATAEPAVADTAAAEATFDEGDMKTFPAPQAETAAEPSVRREGEHKQD